MGYIYVYDKSGSLLNTHQQGTDEELREQYKSEEKIYISDNYLGENAIIENDTARAKTEVEKVLDGERVLQEGEHIEGKEIKFKEKPSNFHLWDSKINEWVYDKELEINALEDELGSLELEKYNKKKEIKELKEQGQSFAAKKLEKEVAELEILYREKMTKYEELEG